MQAGPISRTRSAQRNYLRYIKQHKPEGCDFCAFEKGEPPVLKDAGAFWLVDNVFGYAVWDGCRVEKHLMLVPKRHVHTLADLTKTEKNRLAELLAEYETDGYSIYARAPQNITKSVAHQHTHLVKLAPRRTPFMIYLRKPHLLFFK